MVALWFILFGLSLLGLVGGLVHHLAERLRGHAAPRHRVWAAALLAASALGTGVHAIGDVADDAHHFVPDPEPCQVAPSACKVNLSSGFTTTVPDDVFQGTG